MKDQETNVEVQLDGDAIAASEPPDTPGTTEPGAKQPAGGLGDGEGQPRAKKHVPRKAPPKPAVTSIEDLLRFAYESNARLLELSRESARNLPVTDEGTATQSELIASLAPTDPTLAAPFKLLQYVARQGVDLRRSEDGDLALVLRRLVELSIVAMSRHPVFSVWTDQLVDPHREPKLSSRLFRDEARRLDASKLGLGSDQFKPGENERLVRNAVACYGLLRALQREWTTDGYIDESYESAWRPEAPDFASRERIAGTIAASRDLEVLGLVATNYVARITRLDRRIAELERQVEAAANREVRLGGQAKDAAERAQTAIARAEAYSADIVRLQKELAAERDNRVVDQSHMADDYETLRTRIIRRLSGEIDLLTDGLHALRNGSPGVAEEFLDRSLLALSREVEQLKDAAGGLA